MDNIVIDTNCLIMAISSRSAYHKIWQAFIAGDYYLCISNEILEEYAEVIARNISLNVARYVIYTIMERKNVKQITPFYKWNLIDADPDDNKFVDCAIAANAKFIVTEDHHFDVLKEIDFPSVDVINIDNFLREVEKKYS
ncbi:MAG: putative toxin-antitoxin system toxin component, PIN family [Prevotella sp.]|nr:putative toxin-antitoxin system toxin component, PIN family [Prevotella sp.]